MILTFLRSHDIEAAASASKHARDIIQHRIRFILSTDNEGQASTGSSHFKPSSDWRYEWLWWTENDLFGEQLHVSVEKVSLGDVDAFAQHLMH